MSSTTPGPYCVTVADDGIIRIHETATELAIAGMYQTRETPAPDTIMRDALLLAAAPDLLGTLRDLATAAARIIEDDDQPTALHMRELLRQHRYACAVIAKATGEEPHA